MNTGSIQVFLSEYGPCIVNHRLILGALISGIQARIQVQYSYNTGNYGFPVFFSRLCTGLLRDYTGKYGIILVNTGSEYRTKLVPVFVRVSIRVYRLPYFRNSVSCIIPYLHQNTGKYGKLMACINACFMQ